MKKAISFILFCFFLLDIASAKPVPNRSRRTDGLAVMLGDAVEDGEGFVDAGGADEGEAEGLEVIDNE